MPRNPTHPLLPQLSTYYQQTCTADNGIGTPVLDVKLCVEMREEVGRCDTWLQEACREK